MIDIKVDKPDVTYLKNHKAKISFIVDKDVLPIFDGIQAKQFRLRIDEFSSQKSQSQNAYMWVLLDEIAKVLRNNKEDVYRKIIKDYGVFQSLTIRNEAVDQFIKDWKKRGIGWFCEITRRDKTKGITDLLAYYGTSVYTSKEMSRLIEAILMECKNLDIPVTPYEEIEENEDP
jgi:hypothetical protein